MEQNGRYRKLTEWEYFRLMGFSDEDYKVLKDNGISKTQIYKMAGNSIAVPVLEELFKSIYPSMTEVNKLENLYIFDCEVFIHDWLFVFKHKQTKEYTVIWNDREALEEFMQQQPLLAGFNNKHYDQFILKGVLVGLTPEEIKELNDYIILEGHNGWEHPSMRNSPWFDQYDLMDDCQAGLSLKAIEAHLGMDIKETQVSFDIDRYLTDEERELTVYYCKHDVDATDKLDDLRQDYIKNKLKLGQEIGLSPEKALYMTNAKLTATYLDAKPPEEPWTDEREYQYPPNLKREYIPAEVFEFFDRIHDPSIPSNVLFSQKLEIMVGDCPTTLAYGGIHGAIPCYKEVGEKYETNQKL